MCLNRCKLQILHKLLRRLSSSLDLKGYHAASAVWQILLCKFIILVALQSRIIDKFNLRVLLQKLSDSLSVLHMTWHTDM